MKNTRIKLMLLVGGAAVLTLLVLMGIFNITMNRRIRDEAQKALQDSVPSEALNAMDEDWEPPLYMAESVDYDPEFDYTQYDDFFTIRIGKLGQWVAEHDATQPQRVELDGRIYYVQSYEYTMEYYELAECWYVVEYPSGEVVYSEEEAMALDLSELPYYTYGCSYEVDDTDSMLEASGFSFVEVTREYRLIRQVNLLFLIAAFILGIGGGTVGYFLGNRLQQAQLAEKRFYENASHELKTPLTAIQGYAEGVEKGVITDYEKTGRVITAQTERMRRLIDEILYRAKLESGTIPLRKEPIDLNGFIQFCLMPFEGAVASRGLKVSLDIEEGKILADPDLMEHALSNLITNAIRHAVSELRITYRGGVLSVWNDTEETNDEELSHMFDRFYTGANGGTGIGLSLVREIMEMHGFGISAARTDGGVAFVVNTK